jgi:hypothetical protein
VRQLIDGDTALIAKATYEEYRTVKATVAARVSVVRSETPWAFFCLRGGSFEAPRWLLFPHLQANVVSELSAITTELRARLNSNTPSGEFDDKAARVLEQFVSQLSAAERTTLPRKKQRALDEMELILEAFRRKAGDTHDQQALDRYGDLLDLLRTDGVTMQPNWDEVASRWLEIIRPVWYQRLQTRRRRPLLLRDIRADVIDAEESIRHELFRHFEDMERLRNSDERISACIIGV